MSQIPRESVVSILKSIKASEEEMVRQSKSPLSREYHDGRVSGLQSALDVLTMDERAPFETEITN